MGGEYGAGAPVRSDSPGVSGPATIPDCPVLVAPFLLGGGFGCGTCGGVPGAVIFSISLEPPLLPILAKLLKTPGDVGAAELASSLAGGGVGKDGGVAPGGYFWVYRLRRGRNASTTFLGWHCTGGTRGWGRWVARGRPSIVIHSGGDRFLLLGKAFYLLCLLQGKHLCI